MRADSIGELSHLNIVELIQEHKVKKVPKYKELFDLYIGKQGILDRKVGENKPNNKLMADYYGKLIDTEVGYFLGHPIVFNSDESIALDTLGTILVNNEFDDLIIELGKEMGIKGISYLMVYQDEESETKLCKVAPEQVIVVNSKRGVNEVGVVIRFYEEEEITKDGSRDYITYVEVYDKKEIAYFKMDGCVLIPDVRFNAPLVKHIYNIVPIIPCKNNEEELGSYEKIITLVEAYSKLLSDTSNEHEAYRNAYMVLKNMTIDKDGEDKLRKGGIIELFDNGEAYFLQKPILDGAITAHLDRLSKDIHKFSDIPDMTDENFAGNLSGVAIRFKLLGLENKCIIKERKLTKSIRQLIRGLNNVLEVVCGEVIDVTKLQIVFNRNLPNNLMEIVDSVVKLDGIVDKETLLSLLPFIESPEEVIEKLKVEQDTYAQDLQDYENKMFKEDEEIEEEEIEEVV